MKLFGSKKSGARAANQEVEPGRNRLDETQEFEYASRIAGEDELEADILGRKQRKRRGLLIALAVIAAIAIGLVAAWNIYVKPPDLSIGSGIGTPGLPSDAPTADPVTGETPIPEPTVTINPNEIRNEQAWTFVVTGTDVESGNTDTILVGKFDTRNHKLDVVSIPRDTLFNTPNWQTTRKINTTFRDSGGVENVENEGGFLQQIQKILGFEVDCWANVSIEAFEKIVDTIGGVHYDVPFDMEYEDYVQNLYIDVKAGYQLLDGKQALGVFRYRSNTDTERIDRQQDFLMAVAKEMLQLGNIPKITELSEIFVKYVDSDLEASHILFFAQEFVKLKGEDISFHSMPYTTPYNYYGTIRGVSYLVIDLEPWLLLVNDHLNPYYQDVTAEHVDIMQWSDSSKTATTTQGTVFTYDQFYDNGEDVPAHS